jgi:hypothetical protein
MLVGKSQRESYVIDLVVDGKFASYIILEGQRCDNMKWKNSLDRGRKGGPL